MRHRFGLMTLLLAFAAAGCGGGGAAIYTAPEPVQQVGPVSVQGAERVLAPTTTSSGTTLYALTGNLSKVTMIDANPTLDETEIYFHGARGLGYAIQACSPDGSGLRQIAATPSAPTSRMSVFGGFVYYIDHSSGSVLKRVPTSGGTPKTVRANIFDYTFNLNGTKIYAYRSTTNTIVSMNLDGSGLVTMFEPPAVLSDTDQVIGLISDGSIIIADATSNVNTNFYAISPSGTVRTSASFGLKIFSSSMINGTDAIHVRLGESMQRIVFDGAAWIFQPTGRFDRLEVDLAQSPVGGLVASLLAEGTRGIWVGDLNGSLDNRILEQKAFSVAWSPLVRSRSFVGSGSPFALAGAFLFSERGPVLPAVVWADAATRNTIAVTKISADGSQNTVYKLTCDSLTKLSYTESLNYAPINVVTGPSGIIGVLISFNSETGRVESLSTFSSTPSIEQAGSEIRVTGIDAVYHADKVEHAPGVVLFK